MCTQLLRDRIWHNSKITRKLYYKDKENNNNYSFFQNIHDIKCHIVYIKKYTFTNLPAIKRVQTVLNYKKKMLLPKIILIVNLFRPRLYGLANSSGSGRIWWAEGTLCKQGQWCGIPCLWYSWECCVRGLLTLMCFGEVEGVLPCFPTYSLNATFVAYDQLIIWCNWYNKIFWWVFLCFSEKTKQT